MEKLGYYNGTFGPLDEMAVPMNDRACWFGDGVYEATTSRNYVPFALEEHMDRLYNSARLLKIIIPHKKDEMKDLIREMMRQVDTDRQFVYWQVTRGTADRSHEFPKGNVPANVWVMIKPFDDFNIFQKLKLITVEDTRFLHCNIKTLNLLPNVMAAQKAAEAGCQEVVFHRGDLVTEGAHSNIHILKDGVLRTHPTDRYILPGISRKHTLNICRKHNIPVDETPFTLTALMDADEVFVTSASKLCKIAGEIDGIPVGGRAPELANLIRESYWVKFLAETML